MFDFKIIRHKPNLQMYYIEKRQAGGILDSVLLVTSLLPHTALNSTCVWRGTIFSCLSCNSCLFLVSLRLTPTPMWYAIICLCVWILQAMPTGNMPTLLDYPILSPCPGFNIKCNDCYFYQLPSRAACLSLDSYLEASLLFLQK